MNLKSTLKKAALSMLAALFLLVLLFSPITVFPLDEKESGTGYGYEYPAAWLLVKRAKRPRIYSDAMFMIEPCGLSMREHFFLGFPFTAVSIEPSGCSQNWHIHLVGLPANLALFLLIVFGVRALGKRRTKKPTKQTKDTP